MEKSPKLGVPLRKAVRDVSSEARDPDGKWTAGVAEDGKEFTPPGFPKARKLTPFHEVRDSEKLDLLTRKMKADGWAGSPLVRVGNQLLTGVHRFAAAKKAKVAVPTLPLSAVFHEAGMDLEKVWEDEADDTYGWSTNLDYVIPRLPLSVRRKYGLDWNGEIDWADHEDWMKG